MNVRVSLMLSALLSSPAWADEHSFDLNSETMKTIVRATAATQYAEVPQVDENAVKAEANWLDEVTTDLQLREKPPVAPVAAKAAPAPYKPGFLSALIDTLLDVEPDRSPEALQNEYMGCLQHDQMKSTTDRSATCPGRIPDWAAADPDHYIPPDKLVPR